MAKNLSLREAISSFGAAAKAKLSNPAAKGAPEDQLRAPVERLLKDLAELAQIPRDSIAAVGESPVSELKTRPDYAVTRGGVLVGFMELKAPGKGADPTKFKDRHDKEQWGKIKSLPNLIYTDGNAFSLWQDGELVGPLVQLQGDVGTSGANLSAPGELVGLFESFLQWKPVAPEDAKQLAEMSARLCRLLRDEVTEQLSVGNLELEALKTDWRKLLFPEATDEQFADGYAQAVTFGLLMARARGIELDADLAQAARQLGKTSSLIGTALRILTDNDENRAKLKTSIGVLVRVLNVVHWPTISRGKPDAWLYFYEDFLEVYDNALRKKTGSYYTPPQVVSEMVRLVDEALRDRFALPAGFASPAVTVVDPAVGTGTFPLGILHRIATTIEADQGAGAIPAAINAAVERIIAFEMQLGPFAVAQLRLEAELVDLIGKAAPERSPRMFVTDTLSDPYIEQIYLPRLYEPIAESRRQANEIKKNTRVMVVIGNPPYKEKAKGLGGWVEEKSENAAAQAPLDAWMPPPEWGAGAHAKHLRNLYVYFWRWATWKVFDADPILNTGVVCFITVAGFLNGPGFQKMRDYLRRTADEIWVIDCSPEGHQPEVSTRIFQGVQQPVCIVIASRSPHADPKVPAKVLFRSLPGGSRLVKFQALKSVKLDQDDWAECPTDWRAPFLPASAGAWATFPALTDLFVYNGSGVMPGRTWVIAPDQESLRQRWRTLVETTDLEKKEHLFHAHLRGGEPGDKHVRRIVKNGLPGHQATPTPVADDHGPCAEPVHYAFRSFDRQWLIPDNRLINQPNPELWQAYSRRQVYLTALVRHSPSEGPAITLTGLIPDHDHYKGSFAGRVFPLWLDDEASVPNVYPGLLAELSRRYEIVVGAEEIMAYLAAVAAHPAFVARFHEDLMQPGLHIPITADAQSFAEATELGRTVVWLHTFGERFANLEAGRPGRSPRLPPDRAPKIPAGGMISTDAATMPDSIDYDATTRRLLLGDGYVEGVSEEVWSYSISGKQVLRQWFSYRKQDRERPQIGERRQPSPLSDVQPDHWLAEYTTELIDLLHVLGRLVELEPTQADLLERICSGPLISLDELRQAGAFTLTADYPRQPTETASTDDIKSPQAILLDITATPPNTTGGATIAKKKPPARRSR